MRRKVFVVALVSWLVASCEEEGVPDPLPAPKSQATARTLDAEQDLGEAFARMARRAAHDALSSVRAVRAGPLGQSCAQRDEYLTLRRAVAHGKPWWRLVADEPAESLLGPMRPAVEGGGNLALLDRALLEGDCDVAKKAAFQVEQALTLLLMGLDGRPSSANAVHALCTTAVDLGGILLESDAEVALAPAGVRADALGTLDALDEGLRVLRETRMESQHSRAASAALAKLRAAAEAPVLSARANLVRETGRLGAALRLLARERGFSVKAPFQARVSTAGDPVAEPVSRLTVPGPRVLIEPARAALGRRLFSDHRLSGTGKRSCATCHVPGRAFVDGLARARSLAPRVTLRNTPTLLYASAQAAQLWDGRVITRKRQALRVMHSSAEMGVSDEAIVSRLARDHALQAEMGRVFRDGITADNVAAALAEYQEAELVPASAPIDDFARGEELSAASIRGLDVFAGPGRCARCHVPPLFGGTRPNDFAITVYAVIGTTTDPSGHVLDPDPGRGAVTQMTADAHAFKTPTLRNVARTAPYFHHGGFPTLESVVDFYAKGGGRALGHEVQNQDPDVRPLSLTADQRRDLLAFLRHALTDR